MTKKALDIITLETAVDLLEKYKGEGEPTANWYDMYKTVYLEHIKYEKETGTVPMSIVRLNKLVPGG